MKLKKVFGFAAGVLGVTEVGIAAYFYRRTMIRGNAKKERTMKMAGTDWNQHMAFIKERKDLMMSQPHEDLWIESFDGLKLHATWFPQGECKKVVICFHGYTSQGLKDFIGLTDSLDIVRNQS